ncbi:unnamed protein product [Acanthoscelides obtectus]|uniref:Uncharacterized protein n=1 Tax=Acanthoscelides obtectus TaxID=200917 RepID=A0A9P0JZW1_ACAOB|nr:unnamed protein product [Acanthoscelides obtectus]CAK1647866.1 hypothetical protein AOBTE_LOCUS15432 [Acanthoscelides obtectus]
MENIKRNTHHLSAENIRAHINGRRRNWSQQGRPGMKMGWNSSGMPQQPDDND